MANRLCSTDGGESNNTGKVVLVAGATGFVGRALVPRLAERGHFVRAGFRSEHAGELPAGAWWTHCDVLDPLSLERALSKVNVAYYLVHSMGRAAGTRFRELDEQAARNFAAAADAANVELIVYLGGVAPHHVASEHLASRLAVGEILRAGRVPALELRASMIIGPGSASFRVVRDLALRLPLMVLPSWLASKTRPLALDDALDALVEAMSVRVGERRWFDIPGPETLSGREILMRVAALRGRRIPALSLPWLTPYLSALWLRLVTHADYAVARELVAGLTEDLLPKDDAYWKLLGHGPRVSFDGAVRQALEEESPGLGGLEEKLVERVGRRWLPSGREKASRPDVR